MPNAVMRVFIAIDVLEKGVLDSIKNVQSDILAAAQNTIALKATKVQNMHFTLQFLGEISQNTLQKVADALKKVTFKSFELKICGVGTFPASGSPKIIWAGIKKEDGLMLEELAVQIKHVLQPFGFRQTERFKPHLTIFRIKNDMTSNKNSNARMMMTTNLQRFTDYQFGIIKISQIKLKQSKLTASGPIYLDMEVIDAIE